MQDSCCELYDRSIGDLALRLVDFFRMAVLGIQFVFGLVMFSFLQKLSPYYSFGRWLLTNRLVRYLHPTDEELKEMAGIGGGGGKGKGKNRKQNNNHDKKETFMVPRNLPFRLDTAKVEAVDLLHIQYFSDFQWLADFSLCALVVYTLTEIYYAVSSHHIEFNVSILWCLLGLAFCLRPLLSQTAIYFRVEEGGERVLCILFAFFFLVVSMGILVISNSVLEFGLEDGYRNFSLSAKEFLKYQDADTQGPISLLTFKIILAGICTVLGGLLTFPGLRLAKLHHDALKFSKEQPFKTALLHLNYIMPLVVILMWVKPLARDVVCQSGWRGKTSVMSEEAFESARLLVVVLMFLLRLCLLRTYMQAHLNLAHDKVERLRKEAGKISNTELQKLVARVFYYLGMVAVQYLAPVLMLVFLLALFKTLGEQSWSGVFGPLVSNVWSRKNLYKGVVPPPPPEAVAAGNETATASLAETAAHFTWAISNMRRVFSPVWYRGILSFLMWWVCTAWFTTTSLGMLYYSKAEV